MPYDGMTNARMTQTPREIEQNIERLTNQYYDLLKRVQDLEARSQVDAVAKPKNFSPTHEPTGETIG